MRPKAAPFAPACKCWTLPASIIAWKLPRGFSPRSPCNCCSLFSPPAAELSGCDAGISLFTRIHLPQHLAQDAEPDHGVPSRQMQAADKPPDTVLGVVHAAPVQESAGMQRFQQQRGDTLEFHG